MAETIARDFFEQSLTLANFSCPDNKLSTLEVPDDKEEVLSLQ